MPDYKITSGLPQLPTADEKTFPFLLPIYNAINALAKPISVLSGAVNYSQSELSNLNQVFGLTSQNANRLFVKALEDLSWGHIVTLSVDGGKLSARKADATDGTKPAHGVVATTTGILTGTFGEITMMNGFTKGIAGTTVGQNYWLGVTGLVQPAPPAAAGSLIQGVGIGMGSAGFYLQISTQTEIHP